VSFVVTIFPQPVDYVLSDERVIDREPLIDPQAIAT